MYTYKDGKESNMKKIFLILLLFLLLLFSSCKKQAKVNKEKENGEDLPKVSVFRYNDRYLNDYIILNGDVKAVSEVNVVSDVAGKITKLFYKSGAYVKKGKIVAYIDPSKPGANYRLNPVRAPISGTITLVNLHIGDTVGPGTPLLKISDISNLEIISNISEKFIGKIYIGLEAEVSLEAFPDEKFKVKVKHLNPVLDPISRTLKIKFSIISKTNKIKAGMFTNVKIVFPNANQFLIPKESLIFKFKKTYVYVVKFDKIIEKEVEVEESKDHVNSVILLGGLETGDQIIVSDASVVNPKKRLIIEKEFSYFDLLKSQESKVMRD